MTTASSSRGVNGTYFTPVVLPLHEPKVPTVRMPTMTPKPFHRFIAKPSAFRRRSILQLAGISFFDFQNCKDFTLRFPPWHASRHAGRRPPRSKNKSDFEGWL